MKSVNLYIGLFDKSLELIMVSLKLSMLFGAG
jgi:hypothetical protein